jgi:hypothetical protein
MKKWVPAFLAACGLVSCQSGSWVELDSIEELRAQFNADRGQARLVLLLSPT